MSAASITCIQINLIDSYYSNNVDENSNVGGLRSRQNQPMANNLQGNTSAGAAQPYSSNRVSNAPNGNLGLYNAAAPGGAIRSNSGSPSKNLFIEIRYYR